MGFLHSSAHLVAQEFYPLPPDEVSAALSTTALVGKHEFHREVPKAHPKHDAAGHGCSGRVPGVGENREVWLKRAHLCLAWNR